MRLDWAILSNFAEVQANLSYVLGGGWETAWRPSFPAPFGGALSLRLLAHPSEVTTRHHVELLFWNEDGRPFAPSVSLDFGPGGIPTGHPTGWDLASVVAINLQSLLIPDAGRYSIEILIDGQHVKSIPFLCMVGSGPSAIPPQLPPPASPGGG